MQYPIIISYFIVAFMAIKYLGTSDYKLVSMCCKADYRSLTRSQNQEGREPYCLECKKWCELIEIRETQ